MKKYMIMFLILAVVLASFYVVSSKDKEEDLLALIKDFEKLSEADKIIFVDAVIRTSSYAGNSDLWFDLYTKWDWQERFDFIIKQWLDILILLSSILFVLFGTYSILISLYPFIRRFFRFFRTSEATNVSGSSIVDSTDSLQLLVGTEEVTNYTPEAHRRDSPIYAVNNDPNCQVRIFTLDGSFLGNGHRNEYDELITPAHVVEGMSGCTLRGTRPLLENILVDPTYIHENADLAIIPLSISTWANLGVSKAEYPTKVDQSMPVTITSRKRASTGIVKLVHGNQVIEYHGSTEPGFSGSVYMQGRYVIGMHLGSSTVNIGLPSSLIFLW